MSEDKMPTAPLLRRYKDDDGHEMMAVAAWFYGEMVNCAEVITAQNKMLASAVVALASKDIHVSRFTPTTHSEAITLAKEILKENG